MIYKTWLPNPLLANYIKCYWSLEELSSRGSSSKDRIFPDGCVELLFHFGDRFRKYRKDNSFEVQDRSFVHGQLTEYIELESTGKTGIFGVRFHPNGLKPFIANDLMETTGRTVSVLDIWGKDGAELEDKILNAKSNEVRLKIVESFLIKRLNEAKGSDRLTHHCVQTIIHHKGNLNIDQLSDDLCIGRRQLERRFVSDVGISPKMLSRIIRFQNTLQLIEQKKFNSLTMLAYESSFYDQSHFIKDFKEFTGLTPKMYFSENLELARYFSTE